MSSETRSKHYFHLKGQQAEAVLHDLAYRSFFVDWCFPNPKLPNGKELCDLLVVFDSTAIIVQAKSLKVGKTGLLNAKEVEKNLRQLAGARRQLFDLKTPVELANAHRTIEQFDPNLIREVFLVSVLLGDTPTVQAMATEVKDHQCHVFSSEFTEIVLNELDTINDFCTRIYLLQHQSRSTHEIDARCPFSSLAPATSSAVPCDPGIKR